MKTGGLIGRAVVALAVTLMVRPVLAGAAEAALPPGLIAILQTPEHRRDLLIAAQAVSGAQSQPCAAASYTTTGEVGMLTPYREDAAGKPIAGSWKESMTQTGCGAPRLLNALTTVQPDGKVVVGPLLPGTTIADPELQEDSVQYAAAGLGTMPPGCERGGVIDTTFVGVVGQPPGVSPKPGDTRKPWTERWTLQACAKHAVVGMRFTPDATGTGIEVRP